MEKRSLLDLDLRLRETMPGAAGENTPRVLYDAMETFAPGLLKQPEILDMIRKYLFRDTGPGRAFPGRRELFRKLKAFSPSESSEDFEVFLTILDGISAAMDFYKLQDAQELGLFLQAHKEAFAYRLPGESHGHSDGKNGRTAP
ncbi:MAG: hypothetical protein KDD02_02370 [Phaeodactylibacter sp.]|nr:hypothetical protein [Phaeodactylibacter sp.]